MNNFKNPKEHFNRAQNPDVPGLWLLRLTESQKAFAWMESKCIWVQVGFSVSLSSTKEDDTTVIAQTVQHHTQIATWSRGPPKEATRREGHSQKCITAAGNEAQIQCGVPEEMGPGLPPTAPCSPRQDSILWEPMGHMYKPEKMYTRDALSCIACTQH